MFFHKDETITFQSKKFSITNFESRNAINFIQYKTYKSRTNYAQIYDKSMTNYARIQSVKSPQQHRFHSMLLADLCW